MIRADCAVILDRGKIQADDENATNSLLAATEAGCPNVVSELLARGASMEIQNKMGETPFQIATRLPKTRKDDFEEYLEAVETRKEIEPKETLEEILEEAKTASRKLANVFISQSLNNHDPASIAKQVFDMMTFIKKDHFDPTLLGDEQKFYSKYDKANKKETMLEFTLNNGMIKEREDMIEVMKIVELAKHPDNQKEAEDRIKRQIKKVVPSSPGRRDCLKSVADKFPWSSSKFWFMTCFNLFIQVILGTTFYGLDVYTDINFSLEMFGKSWRIAGAVCIAHCVLPFLASSILWGMIMVNQDRSWKSWTKMPITFTAKCRKFLLKKKLYEVYAREDRNKDTETQKKYEVDKKKCLDKIEDHENIVVLSLVVESSIEASFQVTP